MSTKAVSPLNNPPSRERNNSHQRDINHSGADDTGKGIVKGKGEIHQRPIPVEAYMSCPHCGRYSKIAFALGKFPAWYRCSWCGELQPADSYGVGTYGYHLPALPTPYEELRQKQMRAADEAR